MNTLIYSRETNVIRVTTSEGRVTQLNMRYEFSKKPNRVIFRAMADLARERFKFTKYKCEITEPEK